MHDEEYRHDASLLCCYFALTNHSLFMKSIRFTKPLSLFFITSLLGYAEPLISYSHNAASTTPDFVFDGLASSASLGGGISGTNLASIPQISANQNDGLAPGSSKSPSATNRDWFSYSVSSSNTNIMFETVELTVSSGANGPRLYDLRYMDSNGVEHVVAMITKMTKINLKQ